MRSLLFILGKFLTARGAMSCSMAAIALSALPLGAVGIKSALKTEVDGSVNIHKNLRAGGRSAAAQAVQEQQAEHLANQALEQAQKEEDMPPSSLLLQTQELVAYTVSTFRDAFAAKTSMRKAGEPLPGSPKDDMNKENENKRNSNTQSKIRNRAQNGSIARSISAPPTGKLPNVQEYAVQEWTVELGGRTLRRLGKLGEGGFAEVWKLQDVRTEELFAGKLISSRRIGVEKGQTTLQNVIKEVELQTRCQSNKHFVEIEGWKICHTDDGFCKRGDVLIVMELIKGGDLLDDVHHVMDYGKFGAQGDMSKYDAQGKFGQLVDAVRSMHAEGVAHLDLKLENILLDTATVPPTLKIVDFGLAAAFNKTEATLNKNGGTAIYASPEALSGKKTKYFGNEADVWSLGVVLYAMLTGTMPWKDRLHTSNDGKFFNLGKKVEGEDLYPWVTREAKTLVARMLDKNRKTRIKMDGVACHPYVAITEERVSECAWRARKQSVGRSLATSLHDIAAHKDYKDLWGVGFLFGGSYAGTDHA